MEQRRIIALSLVVVLSVAASGAASTDFERFGNRVRLLEARTLQQERNDVGVIEFNFMENRYELRFFSIPAFRQAVGIPPDSDCLENRYFRIVEFRVVSFNSRPRELSDDCLRLTDFDGTNVLYHLMKAARFFEKLHGFQGPISQRQIIVRVRANHAWSRPDHVGLREEYNNAYYFPADADGRWNEELWFYRSKRTINWKGILAQIALFAIPKPGPKLALLPVFMSRNKDSGIDSAKVPSVIYHEAFHWAADQLRLLPAIAFGRPVADAFCNYFSASILGRGIVGGLDAFMDPKRTKRIDRLRPLRGGAHHSVRDLAKERSAHLRSPFVPSVMWSLRTKLGTAQVDAIVWQTLTELRGNYSFRVFPKAIRDAARKSVGDTRLVEHIETVLARSEVAKSFDYLDSLYSSD
jgi:hypothetical protein